MIKNLKRKIFILLTTLLIFVLLLNELIDQLFSNLLNPIIEILFMKTVLPIIIFIAVLLFEAKKMVNKNGVIVDSNWFGIHKASRFLRILIRVVVYGYFISFLNNIWFR